MIIIESKRKNTAKRRGNIVKFFFSYQIRALSMRKHVLGARNGRC